MKKSIQEFQTKIRKRDHKIELNKVRFGYSEPTDPLSVEILKANKDLSIQLQDLLFTKQFFSCLLNPLHKKLYFQTNPTQYSVCIYKAGDKVIAAIFEDITSQKN